MTGTVIEVYKMGFLAQMDQFGVPTGVFNVLRKTDQQLLGTATLHRALKDNRALFNWNPIPDPLPALRFGDLVQPAGG